MQSDNIFYIIRNPILFYLLTKIKNIVVNIEYEVP